MSGSSGELEPIVVTATMIAQSSADLPASIDSIDATTLHRGQVQENLSETLITVPGVAAQSRQNYAQDLQLSIRGFGARSSFGTRGIRLYSDGIPGTMPDGQGQFSQFDIGSADRIEVLRGPFSALYGNSSGGVISIFTGEAPPGYRVGASADYGTFNTQRYTLSTSGDQGLVNYVLDASHFQTDGYRVHSDAERNHLNGKLRVEPTAGSTLTLVVNAVQTPFVDDPLGLTQAQLKANPTSAGVGAIAYDSRKDLAQEQIGVTYEDRVTASDSVTASVYTGHRDTTQYQAIPQAVQAAAPLYPGAVIDLDRAYYGVDVHVADQRDLAGTPLKFIAGMAYDDLEEGRRGYANYSGESIGVEGALRRDEANHVYDFDQYVQAQWDSGSHWLLIAGVRNNAVDVTSHGHLAVLDDADSSLRYSAVDPVAGITYRAAPALNLYASYGKGFETPTLNDLAYRSIDGSLPGLNTSLRPARSNNYEVGLKTGNEHVRANAAAFYIRTTDELAVQQNFNGRTVEQNIGETNRRGFELALDGQWAPGFSARVAYTYIKAVVGESYYTCTAAPCNTLPSLSNPATPPPPNYRFVGVGSYLPAVPINFLYAGVTWSYAPMGFAATVEEEARARIYADDRNSSAAPSYWLTNARAGFEQDTKRWHFSEYGRIDNLVNRAYVGTVIVNETNSRFFEPAPGRTAYVMFSVSPRVF